jgi:hypothetical protein
MLNLLADRATGMLDMVLEHISQTLCMNRSRLGSIPDTASLGEPTVVELGVPHCSIALIYEYSRSGVITRVQ